MEIKKKEAINPKTNELVKEGEAVLIFQGGFDHNKTINYERKY